MKRLDYIDVAKGICMLLIILGHCTSNTEYREGSLLIRWIYSYHTMAFFIITGLLMEHIHEHDRKMTNILFSSFKSLMLPYYFFQMCYIAVYCIKNGFDNARWMIHELIIHMDWKYATWFLITLFIAKIIYIAIKKIGFFPNIFVAVIFVIGLIIPSPDPSIPFSWIFRILLRSAVAVGFIRLGSILYKYKQIFYDHRALPISLVISLTTGILNGYTSAYGIIYGNPIMYIISALSGTVFVLCLSTHIKNKFLTSYGKNSLVALGTHELILEFFPASILNYFLLVPIVTTIIYLRTFLRRIF